MAAIDERRNCDTRLQRRDGDTVTVGGGCRIDLAPTPRQLRMGAFRQFGRQPRHLPEPRQERLEVFRAYGNRHLRHRNIGGVDEGFGQRQRPILAAIVVDAETAEGERPARVDDGAKGELARVERHRRRQRLEGRAHLEGGGGDAVDAIGL
ncbi:hypothetical protein D9M72_370550 [compost metagenome]